VNGGLPFHEKLLFKIDNNLIKENVRMKAPSYASSNASMRKVDWVDTKLAMTGTDKVEDDEGLRKKLWFMVARHVIEKESENNISTRPFCVCIENREMVENYSIECILSTFYDLQMQ